MGTPGSDRSGHSPEVRALPCGQGPIAHRAPLADDVPHRALPGRGNHGWHQRNRHCAVGHRGQALRRSRLSTARRQGAGQGARLLPCVRLYTGRACNRGEGSERSRLHCGRAPDAVPRRGPVRAVLQVALRQDGRRDRRCANVPRGGRQRS